MPMIPTILALGVVLTMPQDKDKAPVQTPGEAPAKYRLVTPRDDGISAAAINHKGAIVGGQWYDDPDTPGLMAERPIYAEGAEITRLPLLKGYTVTFPMALADDGRVAGRVARPAVPGSRVFMRTQAFVWEKATGIQGLGVLEGDQASFASGISRDGKIIAGASLGQNQVHACVWELKDGAWKPSALPRDQGMTGSTVAISPDGRKIAALDGALPCLWTRKPSGEWEREAIGGPGEMAPRALNDAGTVVGVRHTPDGITHAMVWTRDQGMQTLEKPEGYVRSEALAVNNQGVVVGMIDGPHGSEIGPNPFVLEHGRLRILNELGPNLAIATAINESGEIAGVVTRDEEPKPKNEPK